MNLSTGLIGLAGFPFGLAGIQILGFIIGQAGLEHRSNDPEPLHRQRPNCGAVARLARLLFVVMCFGPITFLTGPEGKFKHRLASEGTA